MREPTVIVRSGSFMFTMDHSSGANQYGADTSLASASGDVNSNVSEHNNLTEHISLWSFGSYPDPDGIMKLHLVLRGIVMPIIAAFGLIANVLNAAVLVRVAQRKSSATYCILLAMTVADFFVAAWSLLGSALFYMRTDPVLTAEDFERLSDAGRTFYNAIDPATNVFAFISNWCTAAVAAARFVAVYYPLKAQQWCTRRCAIVSVATTSAIAVLFAVPPRVLEASKSIESAGSQSQLREYYITYAVVTDVLPWTTCVVFVSLLLFSLRHRSHRSSRSSLCGEGQFDKCSRLTATLISTAVWFIVTTAPSTVSEIMSFWVDDAASSSASFSRLADIGQLLVLINFSGNVFFYSLINSSHRKQFRELLCKTSCELRLPNNRVNYSSKQSSTGNTVTVMSSGNTVSMTQT